MRAIIVLAALLVAASTANAAEIKALISTAMKAPFEEIGAKFEKETGHKIVAAYGPSGALIERVANGEAADLAIIGGSGVGRLIDQGKIRSGTFGVARSLIGAAVRAGARKPDISTEEKFKAVLIEAKSVAYTDPASGGSSGVFLGKLFDRIGLAETLKPKARLAAGGPNGYAATFVANGEAEIAMQPIPDDGGAWCRHRRAAARRLPERDDLLRGRSDRRQGAGGGASVAQSLHEDVGA